MRLAMRISFERLPPDRRACSVARGTRARKKPEPLFWPPLFPFKKKIPLPRPTARLPSKASKKRFIAVSSTDEVRIMHQWETLSAGVSFE